MKLPNPISSPAVFERRPAARPDIAIERIHAGSPKMLYRGGKPIKPGCFLVTPAPVPPAFVRPGVAGAAFGFCDVSRSRAASDSNRSQYSVESLFAIGQLLRTAAFGAALSIALLPLRRSPREFRRARATVG